MSIDATQSNHHTTLLGPSMRGLGEIQIAHPPNTFAITPASLVTLQAVVDNQHLLLGTGIDWGSGTGCLAIAAARIDAVDRVVGLEILAANVDAASANANRNSVGDKTSFFVADSFTPSSDDDRTFVSELAGQAQFILANPPASDGDDGFGWRRRVTHGASEFLPPGGRLFLSVSSQYGMARVESLCGHDSQFAYGGLLASTDWVPFDLAREDLLECLRLYAAEESRGGLRYEFRHPSETDASLDARAAKSHFDANGESPLMKWQTHLLEKT